MSYLEFFFIPYLLDSQLVRWEWTQTLRPAPVLAVGQERNLATGLCRFLAWLCPPFRLYLSWWAFCLPVPTIMAFLFLVLVSSSFFRHLITRKKRGRDTFLLRTIIVKSRCRSSQSCGTHRKVARMFPASPSQPSPLASLPEIGALLHGLLPKFSLASFMSIS